MYVNGYNHRGVSTEQSVVICVTVRIVQSGLSSVTVATVQFGPVVTLPFGHAHIVLAKNIEISSRPAIVSVVLKRSH